MGKIAYRADQYFNNKKKIDGMFGEDMVCPVDLNGGFVPVKTDRFGVSDENAEYAEDNIQERFGLETPDDGDDES